MIRTAILAALCAVLMSSGSEARRHRHDHRIVPQECHPFDFTCRVYPVATPRRRVQAVGDVGVGGIVPALAAKAVQISSACGSTIISGVRHTRISGTKRMSLHASGRAIDMRGNPRCIYAQLEGWPGGYSIDYGRVQHVHISIGGQEDGLRFRHGGGREHHHNRRHRRS